jgi:hypothetical protein
MSRRSARGQSLPRTEVTFLRTLHGERLHIRAKQLYSVGWTLNAIGEALDPPKGRSTVKAWIDRLDFVSPHNVDVPIDFPRLRTPEGGYERKTPKSPGVSYADELTLQQLAPLAREFRSGMGPNSLQGRANSEFDFLIRQLHDSDVSIADIARAANVTHRAISRRLSKTDE